jgi:hypothetical protein
VIIKEDLNKKEKKKKNKKEYFLIKIFFLYHIYIKFDY